MKLQQGQIWKRGEEFVRIVNLERLELGHKYFNELTSRADNISSRTCKKDCCRMLTDTSLLVGRPAAFGELEMAVIVPNIVELRGLDQN